MPLSDPLHAHACRCRQVAHVRHAGGGPATPVDDRMRGAAKAASLVAMDPVAALDRLGGIADARSMLRLTSRRRLRKAVLRGRVHRSSRGQYVALTASDAHGLAGALTAVVAMRSAAAHYGWKMKVQPPLPELAVRPNRKLSAERDAARILWVDLVADDVRHGVTTPVRTVVDCARRLPFDEALAIADSALRRGDVTPEELEWAALVVRGPGAGAVRRVLRYADGRAANPFESVLRALCIEAGLEVEAQVALDLGTGVVHPDLICRSLQLLLEADSYTFHTGRKAHARDCARYNLMVLRGWRVLRFSWEQVMHDQAYVRWVLAELLAPSGPEVDSSIAEAEAA